MKTYYYIFHRIYTVERLLGLSKQPHINSTFELTIVDFLAVSSILYLAVPRWANQAFSGHFSNALVLVAILFLPNYLLFWYNNRYEKINKMFKEESRRTQVVGSILTAIFAFGMVYVAFSIQGSAGH